MKNKLLTLSAAFPFALLIVSCGGSTNPTLGDRIASEGNAVADIGKAWEKGDDMIKKGEKMKRKGKKEIEDGDKLIQKGMMAKKRAEAAYKAQGGTGKIQ